MILPFRPSPAGRTDGRRTEDVVVNLAMTTGQRSITVLSLSFSSLLTHLVIYPDPGVKVALLRAVLVRRRLQRRREEHFEALQAPCGRRGHRQRTLFHGLN